MEARERTVRLVRRHESPGAAARGQVCLPVGSDHLDLGECGMMPETLRQWKSTRDSDRGSIAPHARGLDPEI